KIKWFVTDGCGNETICEYTIIVRDCKAPTVVCLNGLSVNIMPTGMITLWASDFLQYTEDNCTLTPWIKIGIRKCGTGTGFPVDMMGNPITNVNFTCDELGTQCVELWAIDLAGNADYCETYVIVQDNAGNCGVDNLVTVSGFLKTEIQVGVEEAHVFIDGTSQFAPPFAYSYEAMTDDQGYYAFTNMVPVASNFVLSPVRDDNPLNGLTTYDLVLISKHILGIEPLGTPYKMIAADANKSNSITTFDIVELRKLILGIYTELPNNTSWRFIAKDQVFTNPANPFMDQLQENIPLANALANSFDNDFVGVKIGDVNNTAISNSLMQADDRTTGTLMMDVDDRDVKAGEVFDVTFTASEKVQGYQMTLNLNGLAAVGIVSSEKVSDNNFGVFADALTVSVDGSETFTVKFRAEKAGKLSEMLGVSSRITKAEGYNLNADRLDVALRFNSKDGSTISGVGFELYQNQPNPFVNKTFIGFHLPEATTATLSVYDETGRLVYTQKGDFAKGYNAISLDRALINTTGVLYYTLETATDAATKTMIQSK
ncbi:MAG: T9SS type A sorting domain-containing protein, partial [Saprospiraceae bacterium]|nr:T9SS type A sorting domain-containing protein [Saprospiraceae bacterium]